MKIPCLVMLTYGLVHGDYVARDTILDQFAPPQDDGSWRVEGCIAVQMEAQVESSNTSNVRLSSNIPASAKVAPTSFCSMNTSISQGITLEWVDNDFFRNFSIVFAVNSTSFPPMYGISMVSSTFQVTPGNDSLSGQFVKITSNPAKPMMFMVPLNRSFSCDKSLTVQMTTELLTADGSSSKQLPNAELTFKTIQFDAFRPLGSLSSHQFQPSTSCTNPHTSDIFPIVVGGGLAGVVLFIIVCYILGRRRGSKVKGYASV